MFVFWHFINKIPSLLCQLLFVVMFIVQSSIPFNNGNGSRERGWIRFWLSCISNHTRALCLSIGLYYTVGYTTQQSYIIICLWTLVFIIMMYNWFLLSCSLLHRYSQNHICIQDTFSAGTGYQRAKEHFIQVNDMQASCFD